LSIFKYLILKDNLSRTYLITFLHYFKGETVLKALNIIVLPIFTYLLTPEEYGNVAIFVSIYGILIIILPLNIHQSIQQRYLKQKGFFSEFLFSVILGGAVISILLILIAIYFSQFISNSFNIPKKLLLFALFSGFFRFFFEIFSKLLLALNLSKKYSNIHIYWNFSELLLTTFFFLVLSKEMYLGKAYSVLLIAIIFSIISFYKLRNYLVIKFKFIFLKESLFFALPLILHSISIMALAQFDRLIINQLFGARETGIYSVAYSIGLVASIIIPPLINAGLPNFYRDITDNNKVNLIYFIKNTTKFTILFALIVMFFSKEGLLLLTEKNYHEAASIISIIAFSSAILIAYQVYSQFIMHDGRTYLIAIATTTSAIINIIINYLFLPIMGYKFAAITTLITNLLLIFIMYYIALKIFSALTPSLITFFKPFSILFIGLVIIQLDFLFQLNFYLSFFLRLIIFLSLFFYIFTEKLNLRTD
jgi:O-antigen/teichoic acid export membrane protein